MSEKENQLMVISLIGKWPVVHCCVKTQRKTRTILIACMQRLYTYTPLFAFASIYCIFHIIDILSIEVNKQLARIKQTVDKKHRNGRMEHIHLSRFLADTDRYPCQNVWPKRNNRGRNCATFLNAFIWSKDSGKPNIIKFCWKL